MNQLVSRPLSNGSLFVLSAVMAVLCMVVLASPPGAAAATPSISVTPSTGVVGSTITVTGSGFPGGTSVTLGWISQNASWQVKAIPTPQVTGISSNPLVYKLGSTVTDSSGSFSVQIAVPSDYGGSHPIQAYASNGTAISPVAPFFLGPSFRVSPSSGSAGTPINVLAYGLGTGVYSTDYQLYWDNSYVGYITGVSTQGTANFTIYASGTPGVHTLSVFEGSDGPGYLNPQQAPPSASYYNPPYIPFYANFTLTPETVVLGPASSTVGAAFVTHATEFGALVLLGGLAGGAFFVARREPEERRAISRMVVAVAIVVIVAVGGLGIFLTAGTTGGSTTTTVSQGGSAPQVVFSPAVVVDRPQVSFSVNNATTGPRISVSPDVAGVGENVTVSGLGFSPGAQLPLVWTTRHGSNLKGYKVVDEPLRNVTADASGAFTFSMRVPSDLGGVHYIAAGNLTQRSNGTLFIQRTASISTTHGPDGTKIQVMLQGVGWTFNTNIAAIDYDNSFLGYGCGFNSGGNVTFTIVASGAPGIHTIDVYPSVWWGPENFANQLPVVYRLPLLSPQDHPELMPSFHFTFLVTPS
ncbi:MAG: hypothetical protein JRN58_08890 [Nitrososphaerota archaeon]|nr:hypothetical protein [Nitrososphaerota archaeon]